MAKDQHGIDYMAQKQRAHKEAAQTLKQIDQTRKGDFGRVSIRCRDRYNFRGLSPGELVRGAR